MAFSLTSAAFSHGQPIPRPYSRDGQNVSPPLAWHDAPPATQSYVIVVEDPDAPRGTFRHWAAYNIPADTKELPEGAGSASNPAGIDQAENDFGNAHYDGPQPPHGHGLHHYHFRLGALSTARLTLPPRAKAAEVWQAAKPHLIGETELVGTYER